MRALALLAAALLLAAPAPAQRVAAQQQQLLRELEFAVQRLAARFDAVEQRQDALSARLAALERGEGRAALATKDEVAALRTDLAALKAAQSRMRGEIVDDLSGRISAITERQARAQQAAARETRGSGYSHVVEAGQTLSAIAEAYGVSVRAIMKANKIADPTKLQVGQKLFIPDP